MIFSQNLAVIELFSSYVPGYALANLSRGLGFRYGFLRGQSHPKDFRRLHADVIVDVTKLRNLVAKMQEEGFTDRVNYQMGSGVGTGLLTKDVGKSPLSQEFLH
jgi:hypothetical protein